MGAGSAVAAVSHATALASSAGRSVVAVGAKGSDCAPASASASSAAAAAATVPREEGSASAREESPRDYKGRRNGFAAASFVSVSSTCSSWPSRLNRHAAPPADLVQKAIDSGRFFPCESHGAYDWAHYHANMLGAEMGFYDVWSWRKKDEAGRKALEKYESWEDIDIAELDADWTMTYGLIGGKAFCFSDLKANLQAAKESMIGGYGAPRRAVEEAEPEAYKRLADPKGAYASFGSKHSQPLNDLCGVYRLSLEALVPLWNLSVRVAKAGNSSDVAWGFKTLLRTRKKLHEKYCGNANQVTDIARSSIVFDKLGDMLAALDFLLGEEVTEEVVSLKNRFANPVDGYSDFLVNITMPNGILVEMQLHLRTIYEVKGQGGHRMYKWMRRLMLPDNTYEGPFNDAEQPHTSDGETGTYRYADGDVYVGEFKEGEICGHGTYTYADGDVYRGQFKEGMSDGYGVYSAVDGGAYEGEWKADKKEGHGRFTYANGDVYEGEFANDTSEGRGRYRFADGGVIVGEWHDDEKNGPGTFYHPDGKAEMARYAEDEDTGEGAMWSADRTRAWRMLDGKRVGEISLKEAAKIAAKVGLPVPPVGMPPESEPADVKPSAKPAEAKSAAASKPAADAPADVKPSEKPGEAKSASDVPDSGKSPEGDLADANSSAEPSKASA
eukprot:TRINITY_DN13986_c0_g1_i2.p1 TRINITY_DN13986_c0_g1~~TRINITY_DN13986_c0_g1_i2.p1  ORF type:complete len:669 (+),score=174.76 TRINITY_DN13986_c0_g1_i2:138-2144(+)